MRPVLAAFLLGSVLCQSFPFADEEETFPREYRLPDILIKANPVRIVQEGKRDAPTKPGIPPWASDVFHFHTDQGMMDVRYTRFLNSPADFTGTHPSLTSGDMGLGLPAKTNVWYGGNTIRVLLDGQDIFAKWPAAEIEKKEDVGVGRLRFLWETPKGRVSVIVIALSDAKAFYVEVGLEPEGGTKTFGVNLNCYPGGYGPAYGFPSHRWVFTQSASAEVTSKPGDVVMRKIRFSSGERWVFYADKIADEAPGTGPAALLVLPEEGAAGEISVSGYGVETRLNFPPRIRRAHFALYSFAQAPSSRALRWFKEDIDTELKRLRKMPWWPGETAR